MEKIWTQEVEEAFIKYVTCEDVVEKNKIFDNHLFTAFRKLIDVLLERYSVPIVDNDVKLDILSYLVLHISKFNPDAVSPSGKKANGKAYCITIIRCWFADWNMKYAKQKKNISLEDCDEIHMNKIE